MSAKNSFFEKLDLLNRLSGTYLESKAELFEIERESLLQACRAVYNAIHSLPEALEPESVDETAVKTNEENLALVSEIEELKKEIERLSSVGSTEPENGIKKEHPVWEQNPEARYNKLESSLKDELVDQYNAGRDKQGVAAGTLFEETLAVETSREPEAEDIHENTSSVAHSKPESSEEGMKDLEIVEQEQEPEPEPDPEVVSATSIRSAETISIKDLIEAGSDGSVLSSIKERPIENLKKAIGLNDKFLYIRELFDNDHQEFAKVIDDINEMGNISEAEAYLSQNVVDQKDWDLENGNVVSFLTVIYRRFA